MSRSSKAHRREIAKRVAAGPGDSGWRAPNMDALFLAPPRLWQAEKTIYARSCIVYSAIRARSKRMESVATKFLDKNLNEKILPETDPVAMLFARPNLLHDGAAFWACLESYLLYHGGYLVLMLKQGLPVQPGELPDTLLPFPLPDWSPLSPSQMDDSLTMYNVAGWQNTKLRIPTVPASAVVVMKDPDPSGRNAIISACDPALDSAMAQIEIDAYTAALLRNNGMPGAVWSSENPIHEDDRKSMQAELRALYSGTSNAGRTMVTSNKWDITKFDPIKPNDASSSQGFTDSVRKVAMTFGVPEFILGITERANRSTSGEVRAQFLTGTVIPMFRAHERAWKRWFFDRYNLPYRIAFDEYSLAEFCDVIATRVATVKDMILAGVPRNEAYAKMGIPIDDVPEGNTSLIVTGVQRLQDAAAEKPDPPPTMIAPPAPPPQDGSTQDVPPPALEDEGGGNENNLEDEQKILRLPTGKAICLSERIKAMSRDKYRAIAQSVRDKCVSPFEEGIQSDTQKWVKRYKGHVLKRLNYFLEHGQQLDEESPLAKDLSRMFVWKGSADSVHIPTQRELEEMLPEQGSSVANLQAAWRRAFSGVEDATQDSMEQELGGISGWMAAPEEHSKISMARLGDAIQVDDTIRQQLTDILANELTRQPTPTAVQVAGALRDSASNVFSKATTRANSIARTEVSAVMSDYRNGIAKAEKCEEHKWSTAMDGCVRPSHVEAEGDGWIKMSDAFSNNLHRPHDPGADAAEVVNCRCVELFR